MSPDDPCFPQMAEEAFLVMTRRGWTPALNVLRTGWHVNCVHRQGETPGGFGYWTEGGYPDPFTALVEADRWYAENVEKQARP